jgi:serine/threonine-protein kinase
MAAIAADRHLLLGLLALQNGLIQQAQLVAAFQAWTLEKSRPLTDHLVALGHLSPAQRSVVEALAALHLEAHGGAVEKSLAAVPAGKSTLESLAAVQDPDIERTLSQVGSARPPADDGDADLTASYAVGTATADGQRFRVLRPHARGGLGAVFVALDAELNREVALKQILDQHADDSTSRARFLLEAEITGGLEHPGIVPIYGLGSYADGRPFYAMRLIKGDSLKEAADRFRADEALKGDPGRRALELRKLLRRFTDVCDAIGYAHSRGVLHRDIKPGNIIVGKHGETLVVDWGLAKATGRLEPGVETGERMLVPSSASGSAETLPGSALGTPAYMSPEQAEGDLEHLGTRSDVYSLGATLYYLLTGQPPVAGEVHDVIRAVQRGEFRPPRQLDPTIDHALEAVCKKAMAHQPSDRYASPRALSEDVERWMADEPVSAWREPISRRAQRWAKRNRTAVTAATVTVIAGVIGLAAILVVQARANAALADANLALSRSQAAVQARYELAVEAIRTFHTGVSRDFLLKEEKFKELRDRLLKSASDFYGKLGALLGKETGFTSRRALAAANFELADLTATVGKSADALAAHRAVLVARRGLAAEPGASAAATAEVGRSLTKVAGLLSQVGKTDEALASYRQAEELLIGPASKSPEARSALAECRAKIGWLLDQTGKNPEGLAAYRLARVDQEASASAVGAPSEARLELAHTIAGLGTLLGHAGQPKEAEHEYRAALLIYSKLADDNPETSDFRYYLAVCRNNLGSLLTNTGRPKEAEAEYRAVMAIFQKLAELSPAVTLTRRSLAESHTNLGLVLSRTGRAKEAEAEYRTAIGLFQKLVDDNPTVAQFRSLLLLTRNNLAFLLTQAGKPSEAETEYRGVMAIRRKLVDDFPAVIEYRSSLSDSHNHLGYLCWQTGRLAEAEAEFRASLAIRRNLADLNPTVAAFRSSVAESHNNVGYMLSRQGKPAEAAAELRASLAISRELAERNPSVGDYRSAVSTNHVNLAEVLCSLGRMAESRDNYDRAIALSEALVREVPEATLYRSHLAHGLRLRGRVRRELGDPAGAAADARRALGLYDGLPARSGVEWYETACCHATLAGLAGAPGSGVPVGGGPAEAERAMSLLRKAVGMGLRTPDAFRTEAALGLLRDRDDFRALMMDLAMPADPFARGG